MNRMQALQAEESRLRTAMDGIQQRAVDAARDLTDEEETEIGTLRASYDQVSTRISEIGADLARQAATGQILSQWENDNPAEPSRVHVRSEPVKMTPGEYVHTLLRSVGHSDGRNAGFSALGQTDRDSAATLLRVVAETGTTDTAGVLPVAIVGELVKFVDASRPVIQSMRSLPMPGSGKTFTRPRLTQSTQVAVTTEKSQLASRQLTTTGDTVTKATHGGVLNLTEQDIDWTDPAMLDVVIQDLADQYAIDTETTAATAVAAAATTTTPFTISGAGSADVIGALALGAASVYSTAKRLPDTVYAAVNVWAMLAGLVDANDRPVFPNLAPQNAPGTLELTSFSGNPMGLRLVVSPHFADDFFAVAASQLLETYEQNKGLLQVPLAANLEVQIAYRGYYATNVYANGLCSLES